MSLKVFHFYMQMISSLEKLIFMKKELKIKLKKIKRIKETSCKKKRNAIVARCRIRTFSSRSGRLTIVSTKQSLYVLSKIRLLTRYTFVYQSVTHILGKIYKIDIKFTLFTYTILRFWTYDGLRSLEKLSLKHEDRLVSASLRSCEVSFNTRRS